MRELLLPLGLVALGILLLATEAFIPSAGVLGLLATLSLLAGVMTAYYYGGLTVGTIFMVATFAGVGGLVAFMIHKWPHTTLGKLILVEPPPHEELLPDRSHFKSLVGRYGQALALMLPSGLVEIDGERYEATAETTIEKGSWIQVVAVRGGRNLVVRAVSQDVVFKADSIGSTDRSTSPDPQSKPVEDILPDPFDDALG